MDSVNMIKFYKNNLNNIKKIIIFLIIYMTTKKNLSKEKKLILKSFITKNIHIQKI